MTNHEKEQALENRIAQWIGDECGDRYVQHVSATFLAKLLVRLIMWEWTRTAKTHGRHLPTEREQAAYHAGCTVFENILEDGCLVVSNGHQRAQSFAQAVKEMEFPE